MRDIKSAFDSRRAPPAQPDRSAELKPELEQIKLLAQHALQTALAAAESAKNEVAAARAELEAVRAEASQRHLEFASLCARVEQLAAHASRPTVKHIAIQRGPDDAMTGATVTETKE